MPVSALGSQGDHDRKTEHSNKTNRTVTYPVASILKRGIYLELEMKAEKLNVYLKQKLKMNLRLPPEDILEFCIINKVVDRKSKKKFF